MGGRNGTNGFFWVALVFLGGVVAVFGFQVIRENQRAGGAAQEQMPKVLATDPVRGEAAAPVTIIEYGDFQCPLCRAEQNRLLVFLTKYRTQARLVWKDFPVTESHPEAERAAEAARCAQEQGKFWQMHDALFTNQDQLNEAEYTKLATNIGLDGAVFQKCLSSGKTKNLVAADFQSGSRAGVDGTPYYFIGSLRMTALPTTEELDQYMQTH